MKKRLKSELEIFQNNLTVLQNDLFQIQNEVASLKTQRQELTEELAQMHSLKSELGKVADLAHFLNDARTLPPDFVWPQVDEKNTPKLKNNYLDLEESYRELQKRAPAAYEEWTKLFQKNADTYEDEPLHSCSLGGNKGAEAFGHFISFYLIGNVLDIGCGPARLPVYIDGYPWELLFGIDPLPPHEEHPFTFMQSLSEFLPWEDNSFDAIVIGTSFDHVLLLDLAMEEMVRVLKPNGLLLVWNSFFQGAAKYNPYVEQIKSVDEFHLFHFDKPWFEEMMGSYNFHLIDYKKYYFNHFYAYQLP